MKQLKKITQTLFIIFLLVSMLLMRNTAALADDSTAQPTPPAQPTKPAEPTQPTPPTQPTAPTQPTTSAQSTTNQSPSTSPSPAPVTTTLPNDPNTTNNATASTNTTQANNTTTNTNTQHNNAQSNAAVTENSTTGKNSSSDNTSGSATVTTNDANASGTVLNGVNTNLNNVSVSEFNVVGNQNGDIVLDYPSNCILNCGSSNSTTASNGAASTNTTSANNNTANTNNQTNTAAVGNTLSLHADSGNNTTSQNTNGDSAITTGNANVDANSLAFANNNLDGQVEFGVVNIYGNLDGDIILPDSAVASSGSGTNIAKTGNGAASTNTTTANSNTNNYSNQANGATITNTIKTAATTGDNSTTENTSGDNAITTGQSSVDANSLTLANNNLDGGTYWLVLVNNNGNWSGQLLGGDGNVAASTGLNFSLNPQGDIATTNNGAGSTNTTTVTDNTTNNNNQTNNAALNNTLDLSANTGGNHADQNTGGSSKINTGNAKIMANLVDFVNNNLTHGAKLIVTIVNVFGTWTGDFVTPGHTKQQEKNTSSNQSVSNTGTQTTTNSNQTPPTTQQVAANTAASMPAGDQVNYAPTTLVLGTSAEKVSKTVETAAMHYLPTATKQLHMININLAWLVIIVPLLAVVNLLRKKLLG